MPNPPPQQSPSVLDQIQSYGGTISTIGGLANWGFTALANHAISAFYRANPGFTGPLQATDLQQFVGGLSRGLGGAGAVTGSISLFMGIQSMFQNGLSLKGLAGAAQSALGVLMGVSTLLGHAGFSAALMSNPVGWAVLGGVVAFSVVWGLTHHKSPEELALDQLNEKLTPVYWVNGPILAAAAGTAAVVMGWTTLMEKPPVMATLTMNKYYLEQKLQQTGITTPLAENGPTTLVEQGCQATLPTGQTNPDYPACLKTSPSKVMIVSPDGVDNEGNPMMKVTSFELYKDLQFVSSSSAPGTCYIPFFIYVNGKAEPNPAVINGLTNSDRLLQAVIDGRLDTPSAQNATRLASASNKNCVNPSTL